MKKSLGFVVLAALVLSMAACGGDEAQSGGFSRCEPGETRACTCPNGAESFKACGETGDGYLSCQCEGVVATLVDVAAWYAAAPHYPGWIARVELQTRYLLPAQATDLRVEARVMRAGRRVAVVDARVTRGDGALIATGAATFLATERALDPDELASDRS